MVVLSRTAPAIPAPIKSYLGALKEQHSKRTFEIAWDGRIAQTIVVPFSNLLLREHIDFSIEGHVDRAAIPIGSPMTP